MRAQKFDLDFHFSKGFARASGDDNMPEQYGRDVWNIRIKDKGMIPRKGYIVTYEGIATTKTRGLVADENTQRLFRVQGDKFQEINYTLGTITDRSSSLSLPQVKYSFMQFGVYIVLMNGTSLPYIFNTTTNTLALATNIDAGVFAGFGAVFGNYTFLAFGNTLYFSKPVTLAAPANAVFWTSGGSPATQQIVYKSKITGLKSTLDKLWIFTDDYVEYIDQSTAQQVGTAANIFSIRFAENQKVINNDCIVPVGSKLFYITKGKKVRAIGYTQGVAQLQISDISDLPIIGIDDFMQYDLDENLEGCVGTWNDSTNCIERQVKGQDAGSNNITLVYDLPNQAWLKDNGKTFAYVTTMGQRLFAASPFLNDTVYEDNVGKSDRGQSYTCVHQSHELMAGQPDTMKFWRGTELAGRVNDVTNIYISSWVDGVSAMNQYQLTGGNQALSAGGGIASAAIAGQAIAGNQLANFRLLQRFRKVITQSQVRKKGITNVWRIETTGIGQDRILDYQALYLIPMTKRRMIDKF